MLKRLATLARLALSEPSFSHRRSFAGSLIYSCHQTGEAYSLIPAGTGYYVAGGGGRYLGKAEGHTEAAELIRRDARAMMRGHARLAA